MADLGVQSATAGSNVGSIGGGAVVNGNESEKNSVKPKIKSLLLPYDKNKNLSFALEFFTKIQNLTQNATLSLDFKIENQLFQNKELTYKIVPRSNTTGDDSVLYPSDLVQMILDTILIVKELNNDQTPPALNNFSLTFASKLKSKDNNEVDFYNDYRNTLDPLISDIITLLESKSGGTVENEDIEQLAVSQTSTGNYFTVIEDTLLPLLEVISTIDTSSTKKNGEFTIEFNGKTYNFLQVKTELNTLITKINQDFTDAGPGNSTFSSIRRKLRSSKFINLYLEEIKDLQLNNSSSYSNQLKFIDALLSKKDGEETLYKIVFRSYPKDHRVFDTVDPAAYLNLKDKEIALALIKIFTALKKLNQHGAEKEIATGKNEEKDEDAAEEETDTLAKDALTLQELLSHAFSQISKRLTPQILELELQPAIQAWEKLPENEGLDTTGLFELVQQSLSTDRSLSQKTYELFLQSDAVKEAEQVNRDKKVTDLVSFYNPEIEEFIISSKSDDSDEIKKAYKNWEEVIYKQIYEQVTQIFLEKLAVILADFKQNQLTALQEEKKELDDEEQKKVAQDLATSGIPTNIAELLEKASGAKISDAASATAALMLLQERDQKKYKAIQDQIFTSTGLHKDLHLRMQSALLAQLKTQGFAFTRVDEIPLEIRSALFADLQNYLYTLSPEELTRAFSNTSSRTLLLAEFNRRFQLGDLAVGRIFTQFVADNAQENNVGSTDSNDPLTYAIQNFVDPASANVDIINAKLRDTAALSGYSAESGQSFSEYLNIQLKSDLTQEQKDWVNSVLAHYAESYAKLQKSATRNLGNTGFLPFDNLEQTQTQALALDPEKKAYADYEQLRNQYLAQMAQIAQEESALSQQAISTKPQAPSRIYQPQQAQQSGYQQTQYTQPNENYNPSVLSNQLIADLDAQENTQDIQADKKKKEKTAAGRVGQNAAVRAAMFALQKFLAFMNFVVTTALKLIPLIALGAKAIFVGAQAVFAALSPFIAPIATIAGIGALVVGAGVLIIKGFEALLKGLGSIFSGSAGGIPPAAAAITVTAVGFTMIVQSNTSDGMYLLTQESLDVETSKYLEIDKTATPTKLENNTPTEIKYTITIKAKDEYVVTPKLDTVTDTFSDLGKITGLPNKEAHNQAVKDALRAKLAETQNNSITNSGVTIDYSLPALSGEDAFVVNTFKLDFTVVDTQAEGSPTVEDSWKDTASIRIGDPTFSDCFVFVTKDTQETEKILAAKASVPARDATVSVGEWTEDEMTKLLAAFGTRAANNDGFISSLKCDKSRPIYLYRLVSNKAYGGWAIDQDSLGFFDETFFSKKTGAEYTLTATEYTFIHELGHIIDKRNSSFRTEYNLYNDRPGDEDKCPPTYYLATCTETEPFAEAIALFVIYPDYNFNLGGTQRVTYNFPAEERSQYCAIKRIVFGNKDINGTINCSNI